VNSSYEKAINMLLEELRHIKANRRNILELDREFTIPDEVKALLGPPEKLVLYYHVLDHNACVRINEKLNKFMQGIHENNISMADELRKIKKTTKGHENRICRLENLLEYLIKIVEEYIENQK